MTDAAEQAICGNIPLSREVTPAARYQQWRVAHPEESAPPWDELDEQARFHLGDDDA